MATKPKDFKPQKSTAKVFKKKRMYEDHKWVSFSRKFLTVNPHCYVCGGKATVVDHWQAHKGDAFLFWNFTNMMPMCSSDHNYVTANFDRYAVPKTKEKIEYINQKRLENNVTVRIKVVTINL